MPLLTRAALRHAHARAHHSTPLASAPVSQPRGEAALRRLLSRHRGASLALTAAALIECALSPASACGAGASAPACLASYFSSAHAALAACWVVLQARPAARAPFALSVLFPLTFWRQKAVTVSLSAASRLTRPAPRRSCRRGCWCGLRLRAAPSRQCLRWRCCWPRSTSRRPTHACTCLHLRQLSAASCCAPCLLPRWRRSPSRLVTSARSAERTCSRCAPVV
jgi:hypothetical protein